MRAKAGKSWRGSAVGLLVASACLIGAAGAAGAVPKVSIIDPDPVTEPAGADDPTVAATFPVKLSKRAKRTVRVDYATADRAGGATAPGDYIAEEGVATIKKGKRKTKLDIEVRGDDVLEEDENFEVKLTNPKRAKFRDDTGEATIQDTDEPPPPTLAWLAAPDCILAGGAGEGTVELSGAATDGGVVVVLGSTPNLLVPASVSVPEGSTGANFPITAVEVGPAEVTATLGLDLTTQQITVNPAGEPCPEPLPHPVINEVDYDQPSTDAASFIEIYNQTADPVDLTNLAVVGITGGDDSEYLRVNLAGAGSALPSGGYLVIRNSTVTVPGGTLTIDQIGDWIQNGGPDGLALIDTSALTVIDALSYEGSITAAQITGFPGTTDLTEGGAATSAADPNVGSASLARTPNGIDTNIPNADWALTSTVTPGATNP